MVIKVRVGWIGLGKMGVPMVTNLIKAGYAVTTYNRTRGKGEALASMDRHVASSFKELMDNNDIIFIMVSDDQAIHDIFKSDNGLLSAKSTGKIIINMSTVSPAISRDVAELLKIQGNHYLDAPVSGSVKQAEDATLVMMVGGENEIFEKVKPILDRLGKLVTLVGGHGAGNTAKLIINTLLAVHVQGLAEAVLFAKHQNINAESLITMLNNSALASPLLKIKGEAILKDNFAAAFSLKHLAKDLRLAEDIGLKTPLGKATAETYQHAESNFGDLDIAAVIKHLQTFS